jgi:uncharacterized protein (TIGR03067 family)
MKAVKIAAVAALALMMACSPSDRPGKRTRDNIEGNWTCSSAVVNGEALPESTVQHLRLTLTRELYTTHRDSEVMGDSAYTTDPTKQPKQINLVGREGRDKGKEAQGTYLLEGDTLKICFRMPGKKRPTTFESPSGSEAFLFLWKRQTH